MGEQQWKNAQESLLSLEKKNVASVDSIVRYDNMLCLFLIILQVSIVNYSFLFSM